MGPLEVVVRVSGRLPSADKRRRSERVRERSLRARAKSMDRTSSMSVEPRVWEVDGNRAVTFGLR